MWQGGDRLQCCTAKWHDRDFSSWLGIVLSCTERFRRVMRTVQYAVQCTVTLGAPTCPSRLWDTVIGAAVELHSPIFYTHHATHVCCLFLFPFAFISLMFQLPEGGARAVGLWLQSPRVLGFDAAWWLACWLSGLCSGCWLLVACVWLGFHGMLLSQLL